MRYRLKLPYRISAAMALLCALAVPAAAQKCNWSDIENTTKNSISGGWNLVANNDKCLKYFSDYAFWILAGAIGFAEGADENAVKACAAIKSADAAVSDAIGQIKNTKQKADSTKKDLDDIKSGIDKYKGDLDGLKGSIDNTKQDSGQSAEDQSALDKNYQSFDENYKKASTTYEDYLGAAEELLGYLRYVACACTVAEASQGPQFTKILGDCLESGLCEAQDWLSDNVSSVFATCGSDPAPPPQLIDCTQSPGKSGVMYTWDPSVPFVGSGWVGQKVGVICNGDYCYSEDVISDQKGNRNFCYCPKAMQKISDPYTPPGQDTVIFLQCGCPSGTKPAGTTDALKYICLCESTGFPMGPDKACPKPCNCKCPNNQVAETQGFTQPNGTCACACGCPAGLSLDGDRCDPPACAGASEVRIADGSCCATPQVSTCGVCCGPGLKPDANGSCVSVSLSDSKPNLQKYFQQKFKR
jgi:hypothetical protein